MKSMVEHLRYMASWSIMHSARNGGHCEPYNMNKAAKADNMTIGQYCMGIQRDVWVSPMEAEAIAAACKVSIRVVTPRGTLVSYHGYGPTLITMQYDRNHYVLVHNDMKKKET